MAASCFDAASTFAFQFPTHGFITYNSPVPYFPRCLPPRPLGSRMGSSWSTRPFPEWCRNRRLRTWYGTRAKYDLPQKAGLARGLHIEGKWSQRHNVCDPSHPPKSSWGFDTAGCVKVCAKYTKQVVVVVVWPRAKSCKCRETDL